ncbi:hypothetical protein PVK06_029847 [Gossypium arboreum]|uniref:Reverse transcriptase zinc-binding domain-containing protein n=1 Tax=Gossypium arboreum TaxID=29729 RepID=A0ABR0NLP3_GOSAR|nr:hypothetical protein PVK06_029847 [Gossypium arboreum]
MVWNGINNPSGFGYGPHRFFWRTIWKLKMLPKICIFYWRVGHDILPTYEKISTICQEFKKECPKCNYPIASEILALGGLNNNLLVGDYAQCIDWVKDVMRVLDLKATFDFITTLWNSWNNRNNFIFRGKGEEARVVWERAVTLCHDFRIHNLVNKPLLLVTPVEKKWTKPPYGTLKINFDAVVSKKKIGYGLIAHDSDMRASWAKLNTFEESLKFARALTSLKSYLKLIVQFG